MHPTIRIGGDERDHQIPLWQHQDKELNTMKNTVVISVIYYRLDPSPSSFCCHPRLATDLAPMHGALPLLFQRFHHIILEPIISFFNLAVHFIHDCVHPCSQVNHAGKTDRDKNSQAKSLPRCEPIQTIQCLTREIHVLLHERLKATRGFRREFRILTRGNRVRGLAQLRIDWQLAR